MDLEIREKMSSLRQGEHACLIYKGVEDQMAATIPYLKIGLDRNERVVFLADAAILDYARECLAGAGVDVAREAKRGALQWVRRRDHLRNGKFVPGPMVQFLGDGVRQALEAGFSGLRGSGDILWQLGDEMDLREFLRYEAILDAFFEGKKLVGLCQYRSDLIPPSFIRQAFYTHPIIVMDGKICRDHSFYNPTESLEVREQEEEYRVVHAMCRHLLKAAA